MPLTFLRHRSQVAREEAVRALEVGVERLSKLVLNVTALADRLEARPVRDLEEARQRRQRVQVLREAARSGEEALRRLTANLAGAPSEDDVDDSGATEQ